MQEEGQQVQHGCTVRMGGAQKGTGEVVVGSGGTRGFSMEMLHLLGNGGWDVSDLSTAGLPMVEACVFQMADTENPEPAFLRLLMGRSKSCL